ncbi:segregation and condensation protein A [Thalassotalea agarivorans]|uniref:Segregation and condensation protein A n=1 Tax=Thalassotalea agarivorans TaxID=349064 RepID=A0A1I0EN52_THASX|nr:ScpA family protein [Thalassotalea agarivorans]SET46631.1 condensin subunit ScpA [Thalassotalea agarivorans]
MTTNKALGPDKKSAQSKGEMVQQVLPLAMIRGEAMVEKPQDLFIPPDALEVILETFEGPLDLLLYLIRKQKFDILDLPIAPITAQYMEYVDLMKEFKLELAAEYLVMAAILAEIKSRLLLPKQQVDEDEVDPRAELVRRLQEYEIIKKAAENMDELPRLERDNHHIDLPIHPDYVAKTPQATVEMAELLDALRGVMKRSEAFEHHQIHRETLSTRERMTNVLARLKDGKESFLEFGQLFTPSEGKQGVVVTFLAILELVKESLVECVQAQVYGPIQVRLKHEKVES